MAVTTTNLIQGPADLYSGLFGATEPADTAFVTAPTGFTDCGGTDDDVKLTINQTYTELEVDQIVDIPERRMTKREVTVEANLVEGTLANLALALNGQLTAPSTGGTGPTAYSSVSASNTSAATQPAYAALIVDGWSPNLKRRRCIFRKMLQTGAVGMGYAKAKKTLIPVNFAGHYVSASIPPFKIVDGT